MPKAEAASLLIITADDYGYSPRYNQGILAAARAGAIDAVSAMVTRAWCDPLPLVGTGVEVGLHLTEDASLDRQVELFERLFGGPPAYLDGHHHCHAKEPFAAAVTRVATALPVPVRAISGDHRRRLRAAGARTPDRLIGRLEPEEDAAPALLSALPEGSTEWMVHPGLSDPAAGSAFDAARQEDLDLLLSLPKARDLRGEPARRATHAEL